jgi:hypothetical protein
MIDQYFAYSYLTEFLIIGIILTVIGLVMIIMRLNAK